jgi:hypothetical protein
LQRVQIEGGGATERTPEAMIIRMLAALRARIVRSKRAMNGSVKSPTSAAKGGGAATSLFSEERSTRNLSKCVEAAHRTGRKKTSPWQLGL